MNLLGLVSNNNINNINSLKGSSLIVNTSAIALIKERIISEYIVPIITNQWTVLNNNVWLINQIHKQLNSLVPIDNSLCVYISIIKAIKAMAAKGILINQNIGTDTGNVSTSTSTSTMTIKTSIIQLLPEYEIYNSIFGRPQRRLKQVYNEKIISDINRMLLQPNITFDKIKKEMLLLFPIPNT